MPIISPTAISPHRIGGKFDFRSYWTTHSDPYSLVYQAMPVKPTVADGLIQQKLLNALVDGGYYAKAELIDIFATHAGGQNVNWANPGTFDPAPVNAPVFTAYGGYKGATTGTKYVRLNFNPTTNGTKISQNNICCIVGVGDDSAADTFDFGAASGSTTYLLLQRKSTAAQFFNNASSGVTITSTMAGGHVASSRTAGNSYKVMTNYIGEATKTTASNGLVDNELYVCGYNNKGTPNISERTIRYVMVFSALTEAEIRDVVGAMEEYLRNYSKQLIASAVSYSVNSTKTQITIPTSVVDNNEVIHPSVIDIGVVWNGYRYWQVNTPYPASNGAYEIPEIFASNDGVTWVVPAGLTNPIFPYTGAHLYSDPDLYYEAGTLYLFYRTTDTPGSESMIKVIKSTDGITWNTGTPATVLDLDGGHYVLTPSIVKTGGIYYMYFIYSDVDLGLSKIGRAHCHTIDGTYGDVEGITITFLSVAHLSAYMVGDTFYLALGYAKTYTYGIWMASSADGVTFTRESDLLPTIVQTKAFELTANGFYRPDLVQINGEYFIYYSVNGAPGNYMGRQKIVLV